MKLTIALGFAFVLGWLLGGLTGESRSSARNDGRSLVPTFTPAPTVIVASQYHEAALAHGRTIFEMIGEIGQLLQQPQIDDQWRLDLGMRIGQVEISHEALIAMQPPREMTSVHIDLISATADCYAFVNVLSLDGLTMADLAVADKLVTRCAAKFQETLILLE